SSANLSGFSLFILFSQPVRLAPCAVTTRTHYREFSEAGNSFFKKKIRLLNSTAKPLVIRSYQQFYPQAIFSHKFSMSNANVCVIIIPK
ncbi:hypothetical protein, partial [Proteus mirabilis]|uniref:hypothetical protein n=3 Tax=Proteus mirabilis TaxID=584 RepID=UPI001951D087